MNSGIIAIIIVALTVFGAIKTRRCEPFLILGAAAGLAVVYRLDFPARFVSVLEKTISEKAFLILVCALIGAIISLLNASGGGLRFAERISRLCSSERKTLLTTVALSFCIFVDDYLNIMSVTTAMKNVYDRKGIPRRYLSYIISCTSVSVCILIPYSSWGIYFGEVFYSLDPVKSLGYGSAASTYIHALPYFLYPIICVGVVLLFAAGLIPRTKTINAKAELSGDISPAETGSGSAMHFVVPVVTMVLVAAVTGDLIMGQLCCLLVIAVYFRFSGIMSFGEQWRHAVDGVKDMIPVIIIIISAFVFQKVLLLMGMTDFVLSAVSSVPLGKLFPVIAFIITGLLSYMIASSWGVCAFSAPILIPAAAGSGANILLVMAAIISGCAIGNHICFYFDTCVLTAKTTDLDSQTVVQAQLPYIAASAGISAVGFLILGSIF
jgi:Na+/H+ antiporter NhaC